MSSKLVRCMGIVRVNFALHLHRGAGRRNAVKQSRNSSQAASVPLHAIKSGLFEVAKPEKA